MQVPAWLDDLAKDYWRKHYKALRVADEHAEGFAVLCQTYSDYRHAEELRPRKVYLDYFLKLAKEYGLTPKSTPKKVETPQKADELQEFLEGP